MERRTFLVMVSDGLLALPRCRPGAASAKAPRIGYIGTESPTNTPEAGRIRAAFLQGLFPRGCPNSARHDCSPLPCHVGV
jgi:hypothetical protein